MITVTTQITKPANVQWFFETGSANRAKLLQYDQWLKAQPGFLSKVVNNYSANTNSYSIVTVWESAAAYNAVVAARQNLQQYQDISAYRTQNNITQVTQS